MTEFNIQSLPFGGLKLTDDDLNVIRKDNLDNCLIVKYLDFNFIKIFINQNILEIIKNTFGDLNRCIISNVFMEYV